MKTRISNLLLSALLITCVNACLRFVPARTQNSESLVTRGAFAGEEAFFAFDEKLEKQLKLLQTHRLKLASKRNNISSYQVGPGDLLSIKVFGLPEMDAVERISPAGTITLPLVGPIDLAGQTQAEARNTISQALRVYVRNPQVTVFIQEYEAHKVSVVGEVQAPGVYPLRRNDYGLLELLSEAGGRTVRAANRIILIPAPGTAAPGSVEAINTQTAAAGASDSANSGVESAGQGNQVIQNAALPQEDLENLGVEIDLDAVTGARGKRPLNLPLFSGDTIIVPEAGKFEIDGEVTSPGSYDLSSRTSTLGAIAAAGGLTYSADIGAIEIIRDIGGGERAAVTVDLEQVALKGGLDIRLRDGDFVRVPSQSGRFAQRQVVEIINGMFSGFGGRVQ